MDILVCKKRVREELKSVIGGLHNPRRFEAAQEALRTLHPFCSHFPTVLSFSSFRYEIEMSTLNSRLAKEGRLLLPRIENNELKLYSVSDLNHQLIKNEMGILEPNPSLCRAVCPSQVCLVLVPGLGFDQQGMRIGYGRGMYDRLLPQITGEKVGIGFREQGYELLPKEPHDVYLSQIMLF